MMMIGLDFTTQLSGCVHTNIYLAQASCPFPYHKTNTKIQLQKHIQSLRETYTETLIVSIQNQTVNDGVAHSKNPRKCVYHVTFDVDLDLEHTLDAR